MRKLLQNKAAVASLAIVAILCVAGNFVKWPKSGALPVAARSTPEPVESAPAIATVQTAFQVDRSLADWRSNITNALPERDPFRRLHHTAHGSTNTISVLPSLVLQAISIEANKAFAVINRRILSQGETIEGYEVESIKPTSVSLRGPSGQISIGLHPSISPREKSPTAK